MGFYATSQLVRDAQEHGVEVRPVDVNRSNWDCTLENTPAPQGTLHPRHASMQRRYPDDARRSSRLSPDRWLLRGLGQRRSKASAARASTPSAISGCAPVCRPRRWKSSPTPMPSIRSGSSRRDALWAVKALQRAGDKDNLPLFARVGDAGARARRASAVDAAGRAGDRGLSPSAPVAEGASGVVPARRSRRARHRAPRIASHARTGPARRPSAVSCWCGSGRAPATPSS